MSISTFETQTITPEKENERHPEEVSVIMLNTSFGDALHDKDTLERILPPEDADGLAVVGFSEVTPGVRAEAVEAISQQGYRAVIPEGEGKNIDIIWAVSRGLGIKHSAAHRFNSRLESRPGKRHKRDAGVLTIEAVTPNGRVLRLSTERFAPPMRGKGARLRHLADRAAILGELDNPDDPTVDIELSGGDHNHANGPKQADRDLWDKRGFTSIVEPGIATYNINAAGRTARAVGKALRILGRFPTMEFDKMYARAGEGRKLIELGREGKDDALTASQIGYTSAGVIEVGGTDHAAIKTVITLPPKDKASETNSTTV